MDSGMSDFSAGRSFATGRKSMLSQCSEESGKFGEESPGMCGSSIKDFAGTRQKAFGETAGTTMNLLQSMEKSKGARDEGSSAPGTSQMTIFYKGQVHVFGDLTADKANEIMLLASNFSSSFSSASTVATTFTNSCLPREQPSSPIPFACDLAMARKASLQRFVARKRDRIATSSPDRIRKSLVSPSKSSTGGGKAWLELASCQSSKVILADLDPNNAVSFN